MKRQVFWKIIQPLVKSNLNSLIKHIDEDESARRPPADYGGRWCTKSDARGAPNTPRLRRRDVGSVHHSPLTVKPEWK